VIVFHDISQKGVGANYAILFLAEVKHPIILQKLCRAARLLTIGVSVLVKDGRHRQGFKMGVHSHRCNSLGAEAPFAHTSL